MWTTVRSKGILEIDILTLTDNLLLMSKELLKIIHPMYSFTSVFNAGPCTLGSQHPIGSRPHNQASSSTLSCSQNSLCPVSSSELGRWLWASLCLAVKLLGFTSGLSHSACLLFLARSCLFWGCWLWAQLLSSIPADTCRSILGPLLCSAAPWQLSGLVSCQPSQFLTAAQLAGRTWAITHLASRRLKVHQALRSALE